MFRRSRNDDARRPRELHEISIFDINISHWNSVTVKYSWIIIITNLLIILSETARRRAGRNLQIDLNDINQGIASIEFLKFVELYFFNTRGGGRSTQSFFFSTQVS